MCLQDFLTFACTEFIVEGGGGGQEVLNGAENC
jgi:hypothetical protein